ncbi:MAG: HEPN domain-containing protein [Armatimonadota bacterium]
MSGGSFDEWVERAEADFRAAVALDPGDVPGVVCFLCQQCIEKHLKAALARHGIPTRKTHDLVVLIGLLEPEDPRFREVIGPARYLSAFAVEARYPGSEVDAGQATEAVEIMRDLRGEIRRFLNLEADPGAGV